MSLLLQGGKIITGNGSTFHGDILIDNGLIIELREKTNKEANQELHVMNLKGKTIMPGMIDCHTHLGLSSHCLKKYCPSPECESTIPMGVLRATTNAQITLNAGFTTVRDVGGIPDFGGVALGKMIKLGKIIGPRIHACGGALAMTGGHGWDLLTGIKEVDSPDEARKEARKQCKAGVNVLKIMASRAGGDDINSGGPEFTIEEMKAMCEEAHKRGVLCTSHAVGKIAIKNAIEAGMDSIDHGCYIDDEISDLMISKGVSLVATVWVYLCQEKRGSDCGYPQHVMDRSREINYVYANNVKRAWEKGVKIGLGSDCGLGHTPHGENASELVEMVQRVGLTPMDTITLATKGGALVLGLEKEIGTVEEGKIADLLIIDGNPLEDISILTDLKNIAYVIKDGNIVIDRRRQESGWLTTATKYPS